VGRIVY
jgi:Helicase associated domain